MARVDRSAGKLYYEKSKMKNLLVDRTSDLIEGVRIGLVR